MQGSQRQGFFVDATVLDFQLLTSIIRENGGAGPANQDHGVYIEGNHHLVANNLIVEQPNGYGLQIYPNTDNSFFTNNTIANNGSASGGGGIVIGDAGVGVTSDNNLIVDNIVAHHQNVGIEAYSLEGTGNVARDNLLAFNGTTFFGAGLTQTNNVLAGNVAQFLNSAVNPAAETTGDYHLLSTSGAIDRAISEYAWATDLDGDTRPVGGAPDLGAYEYGP